MPASLCALTGRDLGHDFVFRSAALQPPRRRVGSRASYPRQRHPNRRPGVAEIRIVDDSGKPLRARSPSLPLEVGKPFDFAEERESLRELYRTGDYADIRVKATPLAQGVRVDFVVAAELLQQRDSHRGLERATQRTCCSGIHAAHSGRAIPRELAARSHRPPERYAAERRSLPGESHMDCSPPTKTRGRWM